MRSGGILCGVKSLWNDDDAAAMGGDVLRLRAYTSRLLGREPSLVLHGGGNTSVKAEWTSLFGDLEELLYIKGSGWDLASIQPEGFAPVRLDVLRRMAELPALTDSAMVRAQRAAMIEPSAPAPSVEAILHAVIPFRYVDHTHADAVVAVSNTPDGDARIRALYGERVLVVPYVMPGFELARAVYLMTRDVDWSALDGMVLLHHGVFSWGPDARSSYEAMISLVSRAEEYLGGQIVILSAAPALSEVEGKDLHLIATLRLAISKAARKPMIVQLDDSPHAAVFASLPNVAEIATRGPLTPDHVIRTKPVPMMLGDDPSSDVAAYAARYRDYFERNATPELQCLDPAPRWVVWPHVGTLAVGATAKDATIVTDIARHTTRAIQWAESLGGWTALAERDLFAMEYWELEQAKLRQGGAAPVLQGKIAIVTGAASGIGRACAEALAEQGAAVMALDIDPRVEGMYAAGRTCDVTDADALTRAVDATVRRFGGLDILVSNAGLFTASQTLEHMSADAWQRSIDLNLTSHQRLLQRCIPYLRLGIDPAVVLIASKNVPAPGPGAGAYSVAKAGLTQLGRLAAIELAKDGIRVNMLHPHAVFDTGAWTPEVLAERAKAYGLSVEQYKANNLLGVEVTSRDVAALACAMAGPVFRVTTGAQVAVDGGNDRVI